MKILSNDKITVQITDHGAELASIMANGNEYLWQGDIRFWGRRSPVLFPVSYTHLTLPTNSRV